MKYFTLLLCLVIAACSEKAADQIGYGSTQNNQYTNEYFGMTLDIPKTWYSLDETERKVVQEAGTQFMTEGSSELEAMVNLAELQTVNLLLISKYEMGAAVAFNPNATLIAEKISHVPGVKTGADYHFHTRKLFETSPAQIRVEDGLEEMKFDGKTFHAMSIVFTINGTKVKQKQLVTIEKGYALVFGLSYMEESELNQLYEVMSTLKLSI